MPRKKNINLTPKNEKALEEFLTYIKSTRTKNKGTLKSYYYSIQRVLYLANKDYNKIKSKDLHGIFSKIDGASCELIKTKFKIFLQWKKLNKLADSIKINYVEFKKPTKSHEDVLTSEEIQKLINTPIDLRDKALIELYIASGGRRQEISNLKIGDIEIGDVTIWLHINHSKTGHRKIPLVADPNIKSAIYPKNFITFYQSHHYKNKPTKPLFYSLSKSNKGSALNTGSINGIIDRIYKNSDIDKKITPHILRHTSATYDGLALSEQDMCLKYGWKHGSDMVKRYCHANVDHLNDFLLKQAGYTSEKIKDETICPRCKTVNNINSERCFQCNFILDRKLLMKELEQNEKLKEAYENEIKGLQGQIEILETKADKLEEYENRLNEIEIRILNILEKPKDPQLKHLFDIAISDVVKKCKLNPNQDKKLRKTIEKIYPKVLDEIKIQAKEENISLTEKIKNIENKPNIINSILSKHLKPKE